MPENIANQEQDNTQGQQQQPETAPKSAVGTAPEASPSYAAFFSEATNSETANEATNPAFKKEDWFSTRVKDPDVSTKNLFDIYGVDGFDQFKDKETYWKDDNIRKQFVDSYGSQAKVKFDEAYDDSKKEFASFQLGHYQRSQTGYELMRDDIRAMRFGVTTRFSNMAGTLMQGDDWSLPTKDYRENFTAIRVKELDENGVERYVIKDYSPELLKDLEKDPAFGGLAYSDAFYNIDPNEGVNGLYFNSIYDGKVMDDISGQLKNVRNDQIVSRWDLDTGPTNILGMFQVNLNNILKNNKLEADGVMDYAKILVKTPLNTAFNVMDTAVQLTRAAVAGGYGITNVFTDEDLNVDSSEVYKWLTTKGIQAKSNVTSMSREALQDGFFGSLEASLTSVADIGVQVALAGALGRAGSATASILSAGMSEQAALKAQTRAAEVFVRGTLTAMATKDAYNEALENGYSTAEASVITGAVGVAMWKATEFAGYILGDHSAKIARQNIKEAVKEELGGMMKTMFKSMPGVTEAVVGEEKSKFILTRIQDVIKKQFGKVIKATPSSEWLYAAREEGIEEMAEELFQDGVKQAASAYGVLINNAHAAGQGRYSTIFDDGYFKDAVQRYASSGIAGSVGGVIGTMSNKVRLEPISASSSLVDILAAGHKADLIAVLSEMKSQGALGPNNLSTEYNEALKIFEPIVQGAGSESLSDMMYNLYMHDINVVDTFINQGLFGTVRARLESDPRIAEQIGTNAMRKDAVKLMGSMLEFHNANPGIPTAIYADIDALSESDLLKRLPAVLKSNEEVISRKRDEITAIEEAAKEAKKKGVSDDEDKKVKPITEPKDKKEDDEELGKTTGSKATILDKSLQLSKVKESDVVDLLSNYRKVRAIAKGIAAEDYLLQNELVNDVVFGAKYNREEKYADLGETPFKDMMLAMRLRSMEDEKIHASTALVAQEVEAKVLDIKEIDPDTIKALNLIMKEKSSMLSEKALDSILKLYKKIDFTPTQHAFTVNHKESIFEKDIEDNDLEADIVNVYINILRLDPDNDEFMRFYDESLKGKQWDPITPAVAKSYFKKVSKSFSDIAVPQWEHDGVDYVPVDGRTPLVIAIVDKGSTSLQEALLRSGELTLDVIKIKRAAEAMLNNKAFYKNEPFKRKNLQSLFKRDVGGTLTGNSLVAEGLSIVREMVDTSHEGIYTMTETGDITTILDQIDVRLKFADTLYKFMATDNGMANHYIKMLGSFRKNVLDIIDFKYGHGSVHDTEIEEHPYKDYTVTSDFFTDFLFDPLTIMQTAQKDPSLLTEAETNSLRDVKLAQMLLKPATLKVQEVYYDELIYNKDPDVDEPLPLTRANIDEAALAVALEQKFGDNFKAAVEALEEKTIVLPLSILGPEADSSEDTPFLMQGITQLLIAKWVFNRAHDVIKSVSDKATVAPYIKAKERDIKSTFAAFRELLDYDEIIKEAIEKIYPELVPVMLREDLDKIPVAELGAVNIKLENAIYQLSNSNELAIEPGTLSDIRELMLDYVDDLNADFANNYINQEQIGSNVDKLRTISTLVGAMTTDFTPYYSKFKRYIQDMNEHSDIIVAAQEHAAKYAGAYLYSPEFKALADRLTNDRRNSAHTPETLSAVYVTGIAGSGKSSAVLKVGMKIATEIMADKGFSNNAVLPVSTYDSQIAIVSKSIGELSQGLEGISADELHVLLAKADEGDAESIQALSNVGVIAIDEATYVASYVYGGKPGDSSLEMINSLIKSYNTKHNQNKQQIGLLLLGDPKQSGAISKDQEGNINELNLSIKRAHSLAYMDFSFRSRNNFLVDSIAAVTKTIEANTNSSSPSTFLKLQEGTRYGESFGTYYGMNIIDAVDKASSDDFYKVLNDTAFVENIAANIEKAKLYNSTKPEGAPEKNFTVLISPSDILTFNSTPSALSKLMAVEGNEKHFKVVSSESIGGSEANYVIAEIVASSDVKASSLSSIKATGKKLNTVATRGLDFVTIINRDPDIIIPAVSVSKKELDDTVRIPDSTLDGAAKGNLKNTYLAILADIDASAAPVVVEQTPVPFPEMDTDGDNSASVNAGVERFITSADSILNIASLSEEFSHIAVDDLTKVGDYLSGVKSLLTVPEADMTDLIADLDTANDLRDKISPYAFEELIALQAFAIDARSFDSIVANVSVTIDGAVDYINELIEGKTNPDEDTTDGEGFTTEEESVDDGDTSGPVNGPTVTRSATKKVSIISDITKTAVFIQSDAAKGVYDRLVDLAVDKTTSEDIADYDHLLIDFIQKELGHDEADISKAVFTRLKNKIGAVLASEAARRRSASQTILVDIDMNEAEAVLSKFRFKLDELTIPQLNSMIRQLDPSKDSWDNLRLPDTVKTLFDVYTKDSVVKALHKETIDIKVKKEADQNAYTSDLKRLMELKSILGIADDVKDAMSVYSAIVNAGKVLAKEVGDNTQYTSSQQERYDALRESEAIWNTLYKGRPGTFGTDGYGKGFVQRNVTDKATLEDYINAAGKSGSVYTVGVTEDNSWYATQASTHKRAQKFVVATQADATALFNFNAKPGEATKTPPTKGGIRVVRRTSKSGKLMYDVMLYATEGTTNYVISQVDNYSKKLGAKGDSLLLNMQKLMEDLYDKRSSMKDPNESPLFKGRFDSLILDLDLGPHIKEIFQVRMGGIIDSKEAAILESKGVTNDRLLIPFTKSGDGYSVLTAKDMMSGGLNIGKNVFVNMAKATPFETGLDIGNMRGEFMSLYSTNNNIDLDSVANVNEVLNGRGLDENNRLKDTTGSIPSFLGVMRWTLKAPLNELAKVLKEDNNIKMGCFVSNFSLALQKHIIDMSAGINVGTTIKYASDSGSSNVMESGLFTQAVSDHFRLMSADYERYFAGDSKLEHRTAVEQILAKMKKEKPEVLNSYAGAYIVNATRLDELSGKRKASIIYRDQDSGGYIFNINDYLREASEGTLAELTELTDLAGYTLKPNVQAGNTVNYGIMNKLLMEKLPQYFVSSQVGIKVPGFEITPVGLAAINTAAREVSTVKEPEAIVYSSAEGRLLDLAAELQGTDPENRLAKSQILTAAGIQSTTDIAGFEKELDLLQIKLSKDPSHSDALAAVNELRESAKGLFAALKIYTDSSMPHDSFPDFVYAIDPATGANVLSDDEITEYRNAYASILLDFKGTDYQRTALLFAFKNLELDDFGVDVKAQLQDNIQGTLGQEVEEYLNGCKFKF